MSLTLIDIDVLEWSGVLRCVALINYIIFLLVVVIVIVGQSERVGRNDLGTIWERFWLVSWRQIFEIPKKNSQSKSQVQVRFAWLFY